ncbi:hypothetical protein [Phocaeicola sp.]
MDNNNFFSFPRVTMVMKREIMENWKTNLYRFIGLYAAFALVMVLNMWGMISGSSAQISFNAYCSNVMGSFIFIIGIAAIVYASNIMENMITKEKRISFLMLPATMVEKFVARFLSVTVGFIIAVLLAVSLAELTRFIFLPFFNLPESFHQSVLLKMLSLIEMDGEGVFNGRGAMGQPYSSWLGEACAWSFLIWSHSLYILGGSFWYKKPFFKTLGTIILVSIIFPTLIYHAGTWIGADGMHSLAEWLEDNFQWMTLTKLLSLGVALFTALTFFNWWLSYKLFTRSQVIKPKFRWL